MKIQILLTILILFVLSSCSKSKKSNTIWCECTNYTSMYIDYPEEWHLKDKNDKFSCFERNDTLFIEFINKKDYQIDIKDTIGTLYDGNRVVGKFNLLSSQLDVLIYKDNQ